MVFSLFNGNPSVCVVIPVYNRRLIVKDAIESVLMQTYKNVNLILVNDASTDDVIDHTKIYSPRVQVITHNKNMGVSFARNTGISNANTDFIAFLDSDDIFLPEKLQYQIDSILSKNLLISHTNEFWYRAGKWLSSERVERYGGDIFTTSLDKCRMSPSSMIIHKSVFDDIGMFDTSLKVCEDYEWILRATLKYNVDYVEKKLLIKRAITNDQLSNIKHIESIRLQILENFAKNHQVHDEAKYTALQKELERKKSIVKVK